MNQKTKKKRSKKDIPVSVSVYEVYVWECPECTADNHMYGYVNGDEENCHVCGQRVVFK